MKRLTPKKIVIKYLENKNFLVYFLTGLELFDERDFREARRWTKKQCVAFLENINTDSDCGMCPWCYFNYDKDFKIYDCGRCGYFKRHGDCMDQFNNSVYYRIIDKLNYKFFVEIKDFRTLIYETKKAYKSI